MKRISKAAIKNLADINATHANSVTYFPYPENVEKVAYSCGTYGWTGSLYRGTTSGLLYAVTDMGNDCSANGYDMRRTFGARENAVIEDLSHVEEVDHSDHGFSVMRFVSRNGYAFTVATFDFGRTWTVCG